MENEPPIDVNALENEIFINEEKKNSFNSNKENYSNSIIKKRTSEKKETMEFSYFISQEKIENILDISSQLYMDGYDSLIEKYVAIAYYFYKVPEDGKKGVPKYLRIPYQNVTTFVIGKRQVNNERDYIILCDTIQNNLTYLMENTSLPFEPRKIAAKILDHFLLCNIQVDYVNEYKKELKAFKNELLQSNKKLNLFNKNINNMESKIFAQVFTIMTIFTGLAFVLFGGISSIAGLTNLSVDTPSHFWLSIAYLSIVGIILIFVTYFLLNTCIKIINSKTITEDDNQQKSDKQIHIAIPIVLSVLLGIFFIVSVILSKIYVPRIFFSFF